jgi:hypothetical protein
MPALRRLTALALLALAALAAPGCLSPTLPLPPPEDPDTIAEVAPGKWLVAGSCDIGSLVTVFNLDEGSGEVRTCTKPGSYAITIAAKCGQSGFVSESIGDETSSETKFLFQDVADGSPTGKPCK